MEMNERVPQRETRQPRGTEPQEQLPPQQPPQRPAGMGYLVVQVTTASSAIPLAGARVSISETERANVLYELTSGRDGRTERISLPTVPRGASQRPEDGRPFTTYIITVTADGYGTAIYQNVPIFDGITAIQQANLVPVPENGYPDGFTADSPRLFDSRDADL